MYKFAAALAALLVVGVTGCASSSSSESEVDHTPVLKKYFDAFATNESATMEPMLSAAEKGSPAYVYAQHQINASVAAESANSPVDSTTATVTNTTVTLKDDLPADATDAQKKAATSVYADFVYSSSGLIQSWTTEPGGALNPRISAQKGSVTYAGVTVRLKTAYQTNSGDLSITFNVVNKGSKKAAVTMKGYINPNRREVKLSNTPYMVDPAPGAFSTGYSVVTSGKRGGTLLVQFDYDTTKSIVVS